MECFTKSKWLYGAVQYVVDGDSGFTIFLKKLIEREKDIYYNLFTCIVNSDGDWRSIDVILPEVYCANCRIGIRNALWLKYNRISKACKRRLPYRGRISHYIDNVGMCYNSACARAIWDNVVEERDCKMILRQGMLGCGMFADARNGGEYENYQTDGKR